MESLNNINKIANIITIILKLKIVQIVDLYPLIYGPSTILQQLAI